MSLYERQTSHSERQAEQRYREFSAQLLECYQEIAILQEVPESIGPLQDRTAIARTALTTALKATRASRGGVYVLSGNRWERLAVEGEIAPGLPLAWVSLFASRVEPVIQNCHGNGQLADADTVARGFHSFLVTPLTCQETLLGILALFDTRKDEFRSGEAKMARAIAKQAAVSLANEERHMRLLTTQEGTRLAAMAETTARIGREFHDHLTRVCGEIETLRASTDRGGSESPDGGLDSVLRQADEMSALARDLLQCAHPKIHPAECRLQDIVQETVDSVSSQDRFHAVQFSVSIPEKLPSSYWDPHQIQQIFLRLFANAADAMGGNGGTVSVTANAGDAAERMEIVVSDQGPGVPGELRRRVFEPLFTTRSHGNGIGLAVCAQVARAHGGTLRVDDGARGGARFVLTLPTRPDFPSLQDDPEPGSANPETCRPATSPRASA